jgi:hypothetical protein
MRKKSMTNRKYGTFLKHFLCLPLLLSLIVCKDKNKPKENEVRNEIKLEDFCNQALEIHKTRINKFSLCFGENIEKAYNSEREKITEFYQNCLTYAYEITRYITERKTIEYDGKKAYEIIKKTEELLNQDCKEIRKKPKSILILIQKNLMELQTSFYGKLKEGETCYHDLECSSGLICDGGCPGTCKRTKQKEESCQEDRECSPNLVCLNGICTDPVDEGKFCNNDFQCKGDLACIRYKCTRLKQEGESCVDSSDCEILCSADKLCTILATSEEGESCGIFAGNRIYKICNVGLYCKEMKEKEGGKQTAQNFICSPRKKEGENCKEGDSCDIGSYCSPDEGVCKKLKKEGEKCGTDYVCDLGLICDKEEKICKKPSDTKNRKPKGESCTKDEECQSLNCKSQICCSPFNI